MELGHFQVHNEPGGSEAQPTRLVGANSVNCYASSIEPLAPLGSTRNQNRRMEAKLNGAAAAGARWPPTGGGAGGQCFARACNEDADAAAGSGEDEGSAGEYEDEDEEDDEDDEEEDEEDEEEEVEEEEAEEEEMEDEDDDEQRGSLMVIRYGHAENRQTNIKSSGSDSQRLTNKRAKIVAQQEQQQLLLQNNQQSGNNNFIPIARRPNERQADAANGRLAVDSGGNRLVGDINKSDQDSSTLGDNNSCARSGGATNSNSPCDRSSPAAWMEAGAACSGGKVAIPGSGGMEEESYPSGGEGEGAAIRVASSSPDGSKMAFQSTMISRNCSGQQQHDEQRRRRQQSVSPVAVASTAAQFPSPSPVAPPAADGGGWLAAAAAVESSIRILHTNNAPRPPPQQQQPDLAAGQQREHERAEEQRQSSSEREQQLERRQLAQQRRQTDRRAAAAQAPEDSFGSLKLNERFEEQVERKVCAHNGQRRSIQQANINGGTGNRCDSDNNISRFDLNAHSAEDETGAGEREPGEHPHRRHHHHQQQQQYMRHKQMIDHGRPASAHYLQQSISGGDTLASGGGEQQQQVENRGHQQSQVASHVSASSESPSPTLMSTIVPSYSTSSASSTSSSSSSSLSNLSNGSSSGYQSPGASMFTIQQQRPKQEQHGGGGLNGSSASNSNNNEPIQLPSLPRLTSAPNNYGPLDGNGSNDNNLATENHDQQLEQQQQQQPQQPHQPLQRQYPPNHPLGNTKHLCSICGDRATGKHYGVYSCEGCKGFFKRTIRKDIVYACRSAGDCLIDMRQRNRCQYCRYQKCLRQGMKREAVQEEKQRLKLRACAAAAAAAAATAVTAANVSAGNFNCDNQVESTNNNLMIGQHNLNNTNHSDASINHHNNNNNTNHHNLSASHLCAASSTNGGAAIAANHHYNHILQSSKPTLASSSLVQLTEIVEVQLNACDRNNSTATTVAAHPGAAPPSHHQMQYTNPHHHQQQQQHLNHHQQHNLNQHHHPHSHHLQLAQDISPPKSLTPNYLNSFHQNQPLGSNRLPVMRDYSSYYNAANDSSNHLQNNTDHYHHHHHHGPARKYSRIDDSTLTWAAQMQIEQLLDWAKSVPKFKELLIDDQITLLKAYWNELIISDIAFKSIDALKENQVASNSTRSLCIGRGLFINESQAYEIGLSNMFDRIFGELVVKMHDMRIDSNELACLRAIILFNPETQGLKTSQPIEEYRGNVYTALEMYCRKTYEDQPNRFGKLLLRLPALRSIGLKCDSMRRCDSNNNNFRHQLMTNDLASINSQHGVNGGTSSPNSSSNITSTTMLGYQVKLLFFENLNIRETSAIDSFLRSKLIH